MLRLIYETFKILVRLTLPIYFRKISIHNKELLPDEGPYLLLSNHPNTLLDPLLVASNVRQQVFFLANYSLFKHPVSNFFLSNLYCIPIQRPQDIGGKKLDNDAAFAQCDAFLTNYKKAIYIAPEGTSMMDRRLRKIKTGTARIAFSAESKNDFNLGLKIVLVGLNYSSPSRFRSSVFLNVAEPILVADYKELYEKDNWAAVEALTDEIKKRLGEQIIYTLDEEEDQLLKNISSIYSKHLVKELELPKEDIQSFKIQKEITEAIRYFEVSAPERVDDLETEIDTYLTNVRSLEVREGLLTEKTTRSGLWWKTFMGLATTIIGFPIYLYGYINNFFPFHIPGWIVKKVNPYIGYHSSGKWLGGLIFFPLFYFLQTLFVHLFFQNGWITLIYFISLFISGYFAIWYWQRWRATRKHWSLLSLFKNRKELVNSLILQRNAIIKNLESAREEYSSLIG